MVQSAAYASTAGKFDGEVGEPLASIEGDSPFPVRVGVAGLECMNWMVARHLETDAAAHRACADVAPVGTAGCPPEQFSR